MKNTIDIARFDHDFDEFLQEVKSDFFDFKENLKQDQQKLYPPNPGRSPLSSEQVVIRLIEECMEEQQYWIIGEAFNKAVRLVQTYGNTYGNYRYSFWDTLEKSMVKDLSEYDSHNADGHLS